MRNKTAQTNSATGTNAETNTAQANALSVSPSMQGMPGEICRDFDDEIQIRNNYARAIELFNIGYNKSVVLQSVTNHSMGILDDAMANIEAGLASIVAAFEEIRATSTSIANNTERINEMMQEILGNNSAVNESIASRMKDIETGAQTAQEIGLMFNDLQEKTKGIAGITTAIQDVSDKTNILAINASIEAARAGAVGKGFRIIANEVRSLAGQTGNFAKEIESNITDFASTVNTIAHKMNDFVIMLTRFKDSFAAVLAASDENTGNASKTGHLLTQIAGSMKEEAQALGDGLTSLEKISNNAKDTHAVFKALKSSHNFLDTLLDKAN